MNEDIALPIRQVLANADGGRMGGDAAGLGHPQTGVVKIATAHGERGIGWGIDEYLSKAGRRKRGAGNNQRNGQGQTAGGRTTCAKSFS